MLCFSLTLATLPSFVEACGLSHKGKNSLQWWQPIKWTIKIFLNGRSAIITTAAIKLYLYTVDPFSSWSHSIGARCKQEQQIHDQLRKKSAMKTTNRNTLECLRVNVQFLVPKIDSHLKYGLVLNKYPREIGSMCVKQSKTASRSFNGLASDRYPRDIKPAGLRKRHE